MGPIEAEVIRQCTILSDRTAFLRDDPNGLAKPKIAPDCTGLENIFRRQSNFFDYLMYVKNV